MTKFLRRGRATTRPSRLPPCSTAQFPWRARIQFTPSPAGAEARGGTGPHPRQLFFVANHQSRDRLIGTTKPLHIVCMITPAGASRRRKIDNQRVCDECCADPRSRTLAAVTAGPPWRRLSFDSLGSTAIRATALAYRKSAPAGRISRRAAPYRVPRAFQGRGTPGCGWVVFLIGGHYRYAAS